MATKNSRTDRSPLLMLKRWDLEEKTPWSMLGLFRGNPVNIAWILVGGITKKHAHIYIYIYVYTQDIFIYGCHSTYIYDCLIYGAYIYIYIISHDDK